jgi:leader peptidase (prepilin peptidase) / N-methyltransferase
VQALPLEIWLSPWALGLLGLCVGSFLNVVVYRLPLMMERQWWADVAHQLADADSWRRVFAPRGPQAAPSSEVAQASKNLSASVEALPAFSLSRPRSRCSQCGHQLAWHENVPLFGWLRLKGRCAACGTRISARYPIVEAATGALFAVVAWRIGAQPLALLWCAFAAVLLALALIDWDTTLLPDSMTLPLLWGGLLASALGWTVPWPMAFWGAVAGYLSLWSLYWVFKLITGKEGMGYGDFKLLAALGAWLGWPMLVPVALFASVIGAVVGLGMKMSHSLREGRYVPFGPFLAGGGLAVLLAGPSRVLSWLGWA